MVSPTEFAAQGLGLRAPDRHAPAVYLASIWRSHRSCRAIDPSFDVSDPAVVFDRVAQQQSCRTSMHRQREQRGFFAEPVLWDVGCIGEQWLV